MKKNLLAVCAAALSLFTAGSLVPGAAYATDTRINSLSAAGAEFAPGAAFNEKSVTIRDSANIYQLPQFMVAYKNSVDVDATNAAVYGTMNVRYALSDEAVLLLYGKRSPWEYVTGLPTIGGTDANKVSGYGPGYGDPTNHQFGLGFGLKAGESLRLGALFSYGGGTVNGAFDGTGTHLPPISTPPAQSGATWLRFGLGLGVDLNEHNSLDFALHLATGSFTDTANNTVGYQAGTNPNLDFALLAKGEFMVHQIAKLVPYFRFGYQSRGVGHNGTKDDGEGAKTGNYSGIGLNLGADLAITPVEGVLIQPGLGLALRTSSLTGNSAANPGLVSGGPSEVSIENGGRLLMPFYGFAAEAKAFDWMVLRLGARQTIVNKHFDISKQPDDKTDAGDYSTVKNTVTTGVGLKMMGWNLDVNMAPQFFNNGLYAVTGNPTSGWGIDWALGYNW